VRLFVAHHLAFLFWQRSHQIWLRFRTCEPKIGKRGGVRRKVAHHLIFVAPPHLCDFFRTPPHFPFSDLTGGKCCWFIFSVSPSSFFITNDSFESAFSLLSIAEDAESFNGRIVQIKRKRYTTKKNPNHNKRNTQECNMQDNHNSHATPCYYTHNTTQHATTQNIPKHTN
jgi:hypothetical protein